MYCTNPECPDLEATGVPAEFVDGVTVCPTCGANLVETLPDGGVAPMITDHAVEVEEVFTTHDPTEIPIVSSILEGANIPFLIEGMEKFSPFRGGDAAMRFNPKAGTATFVVPANRAEEARVLLTENDSNGQ